MQSIILLITVGVGIVGGFYTGTYFGKLAPVQPGEWRQYVYLGIGIVLILLSAVMGAFLATVLH